MEPGRLRHRVRIEVKTDERDEYGQAPGWQRIADNVPADIRSVTGRDFISGNAERSSVTTRITLRNRYEIRATITRLTGVSGKNTGRVFTVTAPLPARDGQNIELLCTEDFSHVQGT